VYYEPKLFVSEWFSGQVEHRSQETTRNKLAVLLDEKMVVFGYQLNKFKGELDRNNLKDVQNHG